jgi:filamentous hemagglutinin family protein
MKGLCRFIRSTARNALMTAVGFTLSLLAGGRAYALPADGKVVAGQVCINTPSASAIQIEQKSNNAVINWNSFGIGRGETVNITQPATQSILLNRVLGNDPSEIFGTLTANGRLFLVNPNGLLFAPGAVVHVGGLVASSLAIKDSDFLSGKYTFSQNNAKGFVMNKGSLNGGFVALIGNNTTNDGSIFTCGGMTGMAAGEKITLNIDPCGLVAIKVDQATYNTQIKNSGLIKADGGSVVMSASAADALLASAVNNSGKISAGSMTESNGTIIIEGGSIINTGEISAFNINVKGKNIVDAGIWNTEGSIRGGNIQIDATGNIEQTAASLMLSNGADGGEIHINAGESLYLSGIISAKGNTEYGGRISITAPKTLLAGAHIAADGKRGGGSILIGGGWQGNSCDLANAETTIATKSSWVSANALENGNGGTVVLWSEHSTTFAGTIEAKGGVNSGNGGQVEVSGHDNLTISGQIVTTSPQGKNGLLLLDPQNITIDANTTAPLFSIISLPDANPAAGDQHGYGNIIELSNGNIIVASPLDDFIAPDAGAVRLYRPDGTLLSMLCGSSANDLVGEDITPLIGNNHVVALTHEWTNADQPGAGAVTWINGTTGISGSVSEANSLIGSMTGDGISSRVSTLTNGNFVVSSPSWDNKTADDVGAVTWGDGRNGTTGVISTANSLTGSQKNDQVGTVTALANGNYVVSSPFWDKGTLTNAGAVTWGNGSGSTVGTITAGNSLVGSKTGDQVGSVTALTNGNYVVSAPNWDNGSITNAGGVTLVNGLIGAIGTMSAANSLVGSKKEDKVGGKVTPLTNGNYVVISPTWDNVTVIDAGAVTWGDGFNGTIGTIHTTNSLTGSTANDLASSYVTALTNGNYVVASPRWDNGSATDAGAVTWGNGVGGTIGTIGTANSLVGSTANDGIGSTVTALTNSNYVVGWPSWDNGTAIDIGAVTWGDGTGGIVGLISTANSLSGSTANDGAIYNITSLTNGNYVVGSPYWDNGSASNAGAVTWGNGVGGSVGVISAANSLVGSSKNDYAGSESSGSNKVTALSNGNYVVSSLVWDNGTTANTGAVTWGDGLGGTVGVISEDNSLVGSKTGDQVGTVTALTDGNYVVSSPLWNNGSLTNAGAVTWIRGLSSTAGAVNSTNSLVGTNKEDQLGIGGIIPLTVGTMNSSFIVSSYNWSNKTGLVDILTPISEESVQKEYTTNPDKDNIFNPAQITALLNAGNHVILKANNNITINSSIITNNPLGNGGHLELNAGKSILINANITTDNGDLRMVSNDAQANGVVDAWRSAGSSEITMAKGTTIDAGSGIVTIELRDGIGNTNKASADITLRDITAGSIIAVNNGTSEGSGITLASGSLAGSASSGSSIILAGKDFDNSSETLLSTTGTARWIVYSTDPDATIKGGLTSDFRHFNASYTSYPALNVKESGNGFIYTNIPSLNGAMLNWQANAAQNDRNVVTGETPINSFNRLIEAASKKESYTILNRPVHASGKNLSSGSFIVGDTIELPEVAEAFFIFPLPHNLFSHSNPDAIISLEVHSVNGASIPTWMSFDPKQNVISGRAPKEAQGEYRVELIARDQFGGEARSVLLVKIG